jgi:hypothetical protein
MVRTPAVAPAKAPRREAFDVQNGGESARWKADCDGRRPGGAELRRNGVRVIFPHLRLFAGARCEK